MAIKRETDLPVTLKTRPGPSPDRETLFELLDAMDGASADADLLFLLTTNRADLLERLGIVDNDQWFQRWDGTRLFVDRQRPRVELTITPITED